MGNHKWKTLFVNFYNKKSNEKKLLFDCCNGLLAIYSL